MASTILISFVPARVRVQATTAKGGAAAAKEEKGFLDWVLGNLTKEDQFYETDPILNKVDDNKPSSSSSRGGGGGKNSVAFPPKKNNGGGAFGGLFAKK